MCRYSKVLLKAKAIQRAKRTSTMARGAFKRAFTPTEIDREYCLMYWLPV
jgi:hypothetical protein